MYAGQVKYFSINTHVSTITFSQILFKHYEVYVMRPFVKCIQIGSVSGLEVVI